MGSHAAAARHGRWHACRHPGGARVEAREESEFGPSPYLRVARKSEQAFESVEHVVQFSGGGGSGVGGCDVGFVVTDEDLDVLEHYRTALPDASWRVVEDDCRHLRAQRGRMAFELTLSRDCGVVWAGRHTSGDGAQCRDDGMVGGNTQGPGPRSTGGGALAGER